MDIQNKIEQYLHGQMTDAEKRDFEKEFENNELIKAQLELQREIINQIKSRAFVNAQLELARVEVENNSDELEQEIAMQIRNRAFVDEQIKMAKGEVKKGRTIQLVRIAMSVAALFLGVVLIHGIWQNSQMEKLYAGNFEVFENDITGTGTFRGTTNQTGLDTLFNLALTEYERKNYVEAEKQLSHILTLDTKNYVLCFYLGVSQLANHKTNEAIGTFEKLYQQPKEFAYYEETRWYLALANLKIHKKRRANELLNELIELEGYYFDKASKLIDRL
jgi:TolA-binding protein